MVSSKENSCLENEVDYLCQSNFRDSAQFTVLITQKEKVTWSLDNYREYRKSIEVFTSSYFSVHFQVILSNSTYFKITIKIVTTVDFLVICDREYRQYFYEDHCK